MPVSPVTLTPNLVASFQAYGIRGPSYPQVAQGIAQAFTAFLATIPVQTTHIGLPGAGTGTGKVTIEPTSGIGLVTSALTAAGVTGPSASSLATGIVTALAIELNTTAIVQVAVTGVSVGTGVGNLAFASAASFIPLLQANLNGAGILGVSVPQLALGIGNGVATWMKTGIINTVDVGQPAPPPVTVSGVGVGKVF